MKLVHNNYKTEKGYSMPTARNSFELNCLRVIVNEFHLNLEKKISSDLSVILINL